MHSITDLPVLDFDSTDYTSSPFTTLAGWARNWKIARSKRGVELLDYDLCRKAIVDRNLGTGHPRLMEEIGLPEGPALEFKRNAIGFHNRGERRRDLRQPMNRIFAPQKIEKYRNNVRDVVRHVVGNIPKNQPTDMISALCDPIPSMMYCTWVGAPWEDAKFIGNASHVVQQVHTRDPEKTAAVAASFVELIDYVENRIEIRKNNPKDDLLSELIQAEETGELSETDMRNWVIVMAAANTDNSSHSIGITLFELASRPEVWTHLANNPSDIPAAVNEVMRFHPRSISTSREVMQDIEIEGVSIPKGTPIFANIGASHWNDRFYPDPEKFDISRKEHPPHLNFGGGVFSCIGRFFVTMEIEETIAHLVAEHPDLHIEKARLSHSPMFTSVEELVARLG